MGLPTAEWLRYAQRLAVGQVARVRHKTEPTSALTVKNLPDRWTAYCYRCNDGGVVLKSHAILSRVPDQKRFMPWPEDAKPITEWPLHEQETIFKLLLDKGIDHQAMLADIPLWYSRAQGRVILGSAQGWLGRATRGQLPKWAGYGYPAPMYAGVPADAHRLLGSTVVLTEDYFSAIKCRWALTGTEGVLAQACLGTVLRDRQLAALSTAGVRRVATFMDGDRAGDNGASKVARRARGMGLDCVALQCPRGKDPKNLTKQEILECLTPLLTT